MIPFDILANEAARRYGQFLGGSPDPSAPVPGVHNFQTANGGNYKFVGQPAEQLQKQIAAAQGAPAQPPVATPQMLERPEAPPAPPQANQIYGTKDGGSIAMKADGDDSNPAHFVKTIPGRAATKGGLALRSQTSQGGYELDPERLAQIEEAQGRIQSAREAGFQRASEAMAERDGQMRAVRAQLSNEVAVQAHENAVKEQRLGDLKARYEAAEAEFLATPERQKAEREGNKGKTVIEAISQALGALGASLARTPNFAAQVIAAGREREMRQEEVELRVKKDARDSLLGRLKEDLGSMELARTAYRAIKSRESAFALESSAVRIADETQKSQMLMMAEQENQNYLKWREQLERGAQGEISKQFVNVPGSAGSRARQVGITPEEHAQILENKAKAASIARTEAETGKTRAELAAGGGSGKLSDTTSNTLSNIDASQKLLPGVADASRKAGRIIAGEREVAGYSLESDETKAYKAKARSLIRVAAKAVEGDAASESHIQALEGSLLSGDPAKRAAAQVELARVLQEKRSAIEKIVPGAKR